MKRNVSRIAAALGAAAVIAAGTSGARADDEWARPAPELDELPPPPPPPAQSPCCTPAPARLAPTATRPVRIETYEETGPNGGLIGGGVLMFGIAYGSSVVAAASSNRAADQSLFVPLLGPWIDLARRDGCIGVDACGVNETANKVLLVAGGLFQAAGALQILGGFLFPETRIVVRQAKDERGLHLQPTAGYGSFGLSAYGAF